MATYVLEREYFRHNGTIRDGRAYIPGREERARAAALAEMRREADEGQIGVWDGLDLIGYAVRYHGEDARWEPAS